MEIIDAHAHIYERLTGYGPQGEARAIGGGMVEWATGKREQFLRPEDGDTGFAPERLLQLMDEGGIDRAVLMQACNYGFQNSFVAETVRKYPHRFVGAGALDPYCAAAADIFKNLTEDLGFRILKFEISAEYGLTGYHPDLAVDGPLFAPHLARAAELGLTVTVDTGIMGTASFQTEGLCRIRDRHPDLTLVVAHTLFPSPADGRNEERLAWVRRLAGENVYFDVANLALHREPQRDYVRAAMDIVGADHMMWGTDCPGVFRKRSYRELVADVSDRDRFSETELTALLGGTAKRVYQMD
ncbi:MAG: amidohydrolase [Clostridia bacterium]|nr:amidohydrolase [Clostridia bacterium]